MSIHIALAVSFYLLIKGRQTLVNPLRFGLFFRIQFHIHLTACHRNVLLFGGKPVAPILSIQKSRFSTCNRDARASSPSPEAAHLPIVYAIHYSLSWPTIPAVLHQIRGAPARCSWQAEIGVDSFSMIG